MSQKKLFSREIRKYLEVNEKESTTKQKFVEHSVGVLSTKFKTMLTF